MQVSFGSCIHYLIVLEIHFIQRSSQAADVFMCTYVGFVVLTFLLEIYCTLLAPIFCFFACTWDIYTYCVHMYSNTGFKQWSS